MALPSFRMWGSGVLTDWPQMMPTREDGIRRGHLLDGVIWDA